MEKHQTVQLTSSRAGIRASIDSGTQPRVLEAMAQFATPEEPWELIDPRPNEKEEAEEQEEGKEDCAKAADHEGVAKAADLSSSRVPDLKTPLPGDAVTPHKSQVRQKEAGCRPRRWRHPPLGALAAPCARHGARHSPHPFLPALLQAATTSPPQPDWAVFVFVFILTLSIPLVLFGIYMVAEPYPSQ